MGICTLTIGPTEVHTPSYVGVNIPMAETAQFLTLSSGYTKWDCFRHGGSYTFSLVSPRELLYPCLDESRRRMPVATLWEPCAPPLNMLCLPLS